LGSLNVIDSVDVLAEFVTKPFALLWHGNRDGFGATKLNVRYDSHTNTLTLILNAKGNLVGGSLAAAIGHPCPRGAALVSVVPVCRSRVDFRNGLGLAVPAPQTFLSQ
jgi:hypothetical protein